MQVNQNTSSGHTQETQPHYTLLRRRRFHGIEPRGVFGIAAIAAAIFAFHALDINQQTETDDFGFGGFPALREIEAYVDGRIDATEPAGSHDGNVHSFRKNIQYLIEFLWKLKNGNIVQISEEDNKTIMRYIQRIGGVEARVPFWIRDVYYSFLLNEFPQIANIVAGYNIPRGGRFPQTYVELLDARTRELESLHLHQGEGGPGPAASGPVRSRSASPVHRNVRSRSDECLSSDRE
jgi:hypothetical protein